MELPDVVVHVNGWRRFCYGLFCGCLLAMLALAYQKKVLNEEYLTNYRELAEITIRDMKEMKKNNVAALWKTNNEWGVAMDKLSHDFIRLDKKVNAWQELANHYEKELNKKEDEIIARLIMAGKLRRVIQKADDGCGGCGEPVPFMPPAFPLEDKP